MFSSQNRTAWYTYSWISLTQSIELLDFLKPVRAKEISEMCDNSKCHAITRVIKS